MINHKLIILLILTVVIVILLIISYCELQKFKKNCKFKSFLPEKYYILLPQYTGLNMPIYIYNSQKCKKNEIRFENNFNKNEYYKVKLIEHLISKMDNGLKKIFGTIKCVKKSKVPINTLYKSLMPCGNIVTEINPLSSNVSKYKALIHKLDLNSDIFISDNMLFVD